MSARELLERYESEINHHDFNRLVPFIANDCQFWFSSGTYQGLDEVRHAFERTWNLIQDEVYRVTDVHWIAESETVAVCTHTFHWAGVIDGHKREGSGRGTSCFRLEASGWKIAHEHLSHFPA